MDHTPLCTVVRSLATGKIPCICSQPLPLTYLGDGKWRTADGRIV